MAPPDRTLTAMAAAAILHSTAVLAYTYDVVLPGHTPWDCFSGRCANWSEMNGTLQSYWGSDRKSTRLNSSHRVASRMPYH